MHLVNKINGCRNYTTVILHGKILILYIDKQPHTCAEKKTPGYRHLS